jgi:hypothetical protein
MQAGRRRMRRGVGQLLGQLTRRVEIFDHQPAVLARGFDGHIADVENPLTDGLNHAYILYLGKLNDARGL